MLTLRKWNATMRGYGENNGYVALAKCHLEWTRKVEWLQSQLPTVFVVGLSYKMWMAIIC
jgi:hypothetical protein